MGKSHITDLNIAIFVEWFHVVMEFFEKIVMTQVALSYNLCRFSLIDGMRNW